MATLLGEYTVEVIDGAEFLRVNALVPMEVMFHVVDSNVIEVREVQNWNAPEPMDVTPDGMVTDVRLVQLRNALLPMVVTVLGMATVVSWMLCGHWMRVVLFLSNSMPSCDE